MPVHRSSVLPRRVRHWRHRRRRMRRTPAGTDEQSTTLAQVDPIGCTVIAGDWVSIYDGSPPRIRDLHRPCRAPRERPRQPVVAMDRRPASGVRQRPAQPAGGVRLLEPSKGSRSRRSGDPAPGVVVSGGHHLGEVKVAFDLTAPPPSATRSARCSTPAPPPDPREAVRSGLEKIVQRRSFPARTAWFMAVVSASSGPRQASRSGGELVQLGAAQHRQRAGRVRTKR